MNTLKLILAASLAAATTGCAQSMDGYGQSGGGYGYADSGSYAPTGYYASSNSYRPTYYAPTYAPPRTEVVREVRTVPVPVQQARLPHEQPPHQADRPNDHWNGGPRQAENHGAPNAHPNPSGDHGNPGPQQQPGQHGHGQDRDGDGRPDRRS